MSIPDEPMRQYFTLLTDLPLAEVDRLLAPGVNPRDAKEVLGKAIVAQYHGAEAADARRGRVPPPGARARTPTRSPTSRSRADKLDAEGRIAAPALDRGAGPGDEHLERPPGDRAGGRQRRPGPRGGHRPQGA